MISEKITDIYLPYPLPDRDNRLIRVFVPEHEEGQAFPVIYMTDGQNLFEEDRCSFGCWHTRETLAEEKNNSGKSAIIVGIYTADQQRANDLMPKSIGFIPCPDEVKDYFAPAGEVFDDFVINTVMPAVEEKFPVKKGRENTAFCGSSMGGLMTLFTALNHPDVYGYAGIFSPALMMYSPEDMKNWVINKIQEQTPYLYIYTGAGDDMEKNIFQCTEFLYDVLMECYPPDMVNEVVLLDEKHNEAAWEPIFKDFVHTFLNR
ncbi:MAG: alpha/beta hydrolase [Clostridia bacterium]|nr:alpha/beta hydrolase [Clostridia bacterium]